MSRLNVAIALLALGCASPPPKPRPVPASVIPDVPITPVQSPPPPHYDVVGDPSIFLADDFSEREQRRARHAKAGPVFWDLDAAHDGTPAMPGNGEDILERMSQVVVAERHPHHLRVVRDDRSVRLTFYAKLADFHEVTHSETLLLAPDGEPFANESGVTMPAGTLLSLRAPKLGLRRAEFRSDHVYARGAVLSQAIDRVFVEPPPPPLLRTYDCEVDENVELRDAPAGRVVAKLTSDSRWSCHRRGMARDGFQQVVVYAAAPGFLSSTTTIVGFAPVASVKLMDPRKMGHGGGWGMGGGWGASHAKLLYLWPGDALFPPQQNVQVGRVLERALKVMDRGAADSGHLISLPVYPGPFTTLRLDAETHLSATAKYAAWLARATFDNVAATGPAALSAIEAELAYDRHGVNDCYDQLLTKHGRMPVRYEVEVTYAQEPPPPKLTPVGDKYESLESCLTSRLRSYRTALHGSGVRFTLSLQPSDLVD